MDDWQAVATTLKLAAVTTTLLMLIGIPMAWWLARSQRNLFIITLEAFVNLPLIMPPTVLGFYLLIALSPQSWLGRAVSQIFDLQLAFSFEALVIGSILYSLPFVLQPLQSAFEKVPAAQLEAAAAFGASRCYRLFTIVLPSCRNSLLSAGILGFAHTVGEFGVVLMVGGSIPGETRVVSIALYEHVEALRYENAHELAGALLLSSFICLVILYSLNQKSPKICP